MSEYDTETRLRLNGRNLENFECRILPRVHDRQFSADGLDWKTIRGNNQSVLYNIFSLQFEINLPSTNGFRG